MTADDIKSKVIEFLVSKAGVVASSISAAILAHFIASYHVYLGSVEVFFGINDTQLNGYLTAGILGIFMAGIGWLKTHWTTDGMKSVQDLLATATGLPIKSDGFALPDGQTINALKQVIATGATSATDSAKAQPIKPAI